MRYQALALLLLLLIIGCVNTGTGITGDVVLLVHPSACQTTPDGPAWNGEMWVIGASRGLLRCPIPVQAGDSITEWSLGLQRDSFTSLGPVIAARIERLDAATGTREGIGMAATDTTKAIGPIVLDIAIDPPEVVGDAAAYDLTIAGDGVEGDRVGVIAVHVTR